jgi:methionyl-tRNA formyltransferase
MSRVVVFTAPDHPLAEPAIEAAGDAIVATVTGPPTLDFAWLKPTHGISAGYRHIIPPEVIALFPQGIVNVHTGYLPYGRGAHPNAWATANREPAGVTLHLMDHGVDTGPILVQSSVPVLETDTAQTLHYRLTDVASEMLRRDAYLWIRGFPYEPKPQGLGYNPTRRKRDLDAVLTLDASQEMNVGEVIDTIRARTFPPHAGCPYLVDGKRYRLRIEITEETT